MTEWVMWLCLCCGQRQPYGNEAFGSLAYFSRCFRLRALFSGLSSTSCTSVLGILIPPPPKDVGKLLKICGSLT